MTSIPATVLNVDRQGTEYVVTVQVGAGRYFRASSTGLVSKINLIRDGITMVGLNWFAIEIPDSVQANSPRFGSFSNSRFPSLIPFELEADSDLPVLGSAVRQTFIQGSNIMSSLAEDYLQQDRAVHDFLFVVFVDTHVLNIFERFEQFSLNQIQVSAYVHLILV
jgi:hypothetical protein